MLRKFKITYAEVKTTREQKMLSVEIDAASKYDAKSKFYKKHTAEEIVKVEEVTDEQR